MSKVEPDRYCQRFSAHLKKMRIKRLKEVRLKRYLKNWLQPLPVGEASNMQNADDYIMPNFLKYKQP